MKKLYSILLAIFLTFGFLNAKGVVKHNDPTSSTATLIGVVWWDKNLNGIQDESNLGIAGIRVHLYKNGIDTGEMVTTQTMGLGMYKFENLEPDNNYTVKIDLPRNYPDFTLQNKGSDNQKDSDIVNWVWRSESVYLKAGDTGYLDAGLICKYCAQLHLEKRTNGILVKDINDIPKIKVGEQVTWEYTVYNDSTKLTITDIKVTDDKEGVISCPKTSLEPGEFMKCKKTGIAKIGKYSNLGKVTGKTDDKNLTDEYPSNYFGVEAKIDIEKSTNGQDADTAPGVEVGVGEEITWKYVVKNIGNIKLENVVVKDDKEGIIDCPKDSLDVNESMTCIKKGIAKKGDYKNIATATATSSVGDVNDSDPSHYIGIGGCIGNFVWLDENLNGIQDSGEPGVINIKVSLLDSNGNVLKTTYTDNQGKYKFCDLNPGDYKVKFEQPPTYLFTFPNKGSDLRDSDVNSEGVSDTVHLNPGENDMSVDAGIYCECSDYLVHPNNYKRLSFAISMEANLILIIFILATIYTIKLIRKD